MKYCFLSATVAMITVKVPFTNFHSSNSLGNIKIMQPISPNYNLENGFKKIKTTEENLSQSWILCQLLRTKTLASG